MGFWSGLLQDIAGAAEIAVGVLAEVGTLGLSTPLSAMLITSGAGMILSGIGTMLEGNGTKDGSSTTVRDTVGSWRIVYGQTRVGGTCLYLGQWGDKGSTFTPIMADLIHVLACHQCASIDELLADQQRVQIDTTRIPTNASAGYTIPRQPDSGAGTSFTPLNAGQTPYDIASITRNIYGIVTVVLDADIPYLIAGDQITIRNVTGDLSLNGTFQVAEIISRISGVLTFSYLSGGTVGGPYTGAGEAVTNWSNYNNNIYFEPVLGTQVLGQTAAGMTAGTPWQGTARLVTPASPWNAGGQAAPNPWTNYCSLAGHTYAFLRLQYDSQYFPAGMPKFSYLLSGNNHIYDPRIGDTEDPSAYVWTANSALVIADFLTNSVYGFGLQYGVDIPIDPLIAAANVCDVQIPLNAGGYENQWECNGSFEISKTRGEILDELLSSCAGRLSIVGGQYFIQPAQWVDPLEDTYDLLANAVGKGGTWKPTVQIDKKFNGCKGTYCSALNLYQSTDFPPYTQDVDRGYLPGSAWSSATSYSIGDYAIYDDVSYVSLTNSNLDNVPEVGTYWALTSGGVDINQIADLGQRRWKDIVLNGTTSYSMAQRAAKVELMRSRQFGTGTFECNMSAYQFAPFDVIKVNHSQLGWSEKVVEVQAVRLKTNKDDKGNEWLSVELDIQETDESVYVWSQEEELSPQGYQQSVLPINSVGEVLPFQFSPGFVAPMAGDVYEGQAATFGMMPVYAADANGNPTINLQINGYPPVNDLDETISGPVISVTASGSGSTLAAGDYVVGVSARNGSGSTYGITDFLSIATVNVSTGQNIVIDITTWGSGDVGGDVYLSTWEPYKAYTFHWQQSVSAGASSATVSSFVQSTPAGPDPLYDHIQVVANQIHHGGIWAEQVAAVTDTTVTFNDNGGTTSDQFAGYTLSMYSKFCPYVEVPLLNLPIASNTASSGNQFTVTIGANGLGNTMESLQTVIATVGGVSIHLVDVFDVMVCRYNPTFTSNSFTDVNNINSFAPTGLFGDYSVGLAAMVLTGPDAGDVQTITSITSSTGSMTTADTFNINGTWATTPNAGDMVIIVDPATQPLITGQSQNILQSLSQILCSPSILNEEGGQFLYRIRACDLLGNYGPDNLAPSRQYYIFGAGLTRQTWVSTTQIYSDGRIECGSLSVPLTGNIVVTLLPEALMEQTRLTIIKLDSSAYTVTVNTYTDPTTHISDIFGDGTTSFVLTTQGSNREIKF